MTEVMRLSLWRLPQVIDRIVTVVNWNLRSPRISHATAAFIVELNRQCCGNKGETIKKGNRLYEMEHIQTTHQRSWNVEYQTRRVFLLDWNGEWLSWGHSLIKQIVEDKSVSWWRDFYRAASPNKLNLELLLIYITEKFSLVDIWI